MRKLRLGQSALLRASLARGELGWLARGARNLLAVKLSAKLPRGRAVNAPLMGGLIVTSRCNLRCPMCGLRSRPEARLDAAGWKGVIDDMAELGVGVIGITGGEPLLEPCLFELIAHVRGRGLPCALSTNGVLLGTDDACARLVEAEPSCVNISLDHASPEAHDRMRGQPGAFEATLRGTKDLLGRIRAGGKDIQVCFVTVLSAQNLRELEAISRLCRDVGVHRWGVMPLHAIAENRCRVAPEPALRSVAAEIARCGANIPLDNSPEYLESLGPAFQGLPLPVRCNAGYASVYVDAGRNVYPCFPYYAIGEGAPRLALGDASLKAIWNSAAYRAVRAAAASCQDCYWNCQAELSFLVRI